MKLNPDCIRDILLYIEDTSDGCSTYAITSDIVKEEKYLKEYSIKEVLYHAQQCDNNNFIVGFKYMPMDDQIYFIDLTPNAHNFLANIRSDNIWNKTKLQAQKIGSISLDALIHIASEIIINKSPFI